MSEIKAAISAVEDDIPEAVQNAIATGDATEATEGGSKPRKVRPKPGQIGEGKGAPLSKNQRKRALYVLHSCPRVGRHMVASGPCMFGRRSSRRGFLLQTSRADAHSHDLSNAGIRSESVPDHTHARAEHTPEA